MTGYLQRMASSAIRPGGSVRPVAGTVFSASRYRPGPDPSVMEREILAAKPDELDARRESAPRPPAREPTPLPQAARGPREAGPEPRRAPLEVSAERPAAAEGNGRPPVPARPRPDTESTAPAPGLPRAPEPRPDVRRAVARREAVPPERVPARFQEGAESPRSEAGEARTSRVEPGSRARPFAPVVAGDFRPAAPAKAIFPGTSDPARLAGNRERNGAGKVPAAPSEPDEINIHIGRIEVTAAQPAALRPAAPKPRRKAPSLDEYLRRRTGRLS